MQGLSARARSLVRSPDAVFASLWIASLVAGLLVFRDFGLAWDEPLFYRYSDAVGYAYSIPAWLSGSFDLTQAYGYHFFDIRQERWDPQAARRIGIPLEKMPRLCAPTEVIGSVTAQAAAQTGLAAGTPVTLTLDAWWNIEETYDYGYVMASADGTRWAEVWTVPGVRREGDGLHSR